MSNKTILPRKLLWRLTFTNVIIITIFIMISGYAIYNTACFLVGDLGPLRQGTQGQFNRTLFQYLIYFSIATIFLGSIVHMYITKAILKPLQQLIDSTKVMKTGIYPEEINVTSNDEIGQLTNQFNELIEKIARNEQYRKKLITDLSHELKTPLTNLNGYLKALHDGVIDGDETLYGSLYDELQRMTKLLEQMEQLKRWDYEKEVSSKETQLVSMSDIVNQSLSLFQLRLAQNNLDIKVQVENCSLHMHEESILQVLNNLIDNAIRYYEGTGPIMITGERGEQHYTVQVAGPSIDIPDDAVQFLFDRFYRVDPSRAKETGGAGLGLAISKEIIEHHGGKIFMQSNCHKQIFSFVIPIKEK